MRTLFAKRTYTLALGLILVLLGVAGTTQAQDQNEVQINFGYGINFPTGAFKSDLITHPAFKGFTGGIACSLNNRLSIGLDLGYNDYYQKYPRQVYPDGGGSDISAVLSNSIQQVPLLAKADYTLTKKGFIRPYVGAGVGVNFISFDQYVGEFDDPHSMVRLAVKGEAGFYIPLSSYKSTALKIGGSYNYAPFNTYGINNLSNWGLEAGIRFPIH